jgi:hypothetical protein
LTVRADNRGYADRLPSFGLDLRVGRQLWSVTGERLPLAGVGAVTRVYRVPLGWVYGGAEQVRLLRPDGTSTVLANPGTHWLVSPDGALLAYVRSRQLTISKIGKRGLVPVAAVAVPEPSRPVAFAGEHLVVAGGRAGPYGLLSLTAPAPPRWNAHVADVYGAAGDRVTGLVRGAGTDALCLATLRAVADTLVPTGTGACRSEPVAEATRELAPDGKWLAETGADATTLVRVDRALAGGEATVSCPGAGPVAPVWTDPTTIVAGGGRRAVRCGTDGSAEYAALPAGVTGDWALVPRLVPERTR